MSGKSDIFESAFFISPEEEDQGESNFPGYIGPPAGYLRRRFFIEPGKKCVLYVGVHGVAEIYINGTSVTKGVLFPGPFDHFKGLPVGAFDVTHLLKKGENEFAAVLGNGWYRSYNITEKKRNLYGADLSLIAALYSDNVCVLRSDNSFEASNAGPIRENDLVLGENFDSNFGRINFSRSARELDIKKNYYDAIPKTIISDRIKPHDIITAKRISMDLCDFGRYVSGGITFTIYDAPAGGTVTFTFVDNPELEKRSLERNRRITYRTRRGTNNYTSHFSVFSMRYAVIDADFDLKYFKLSAIPYYSDMKVRAAFRSSNSSLNSAFQKCIDSAKGFFTGLFSDGYSAKGEGAGKMIYLTAGAKGALELMASEENLRLYLKRIFAWQKNNGAISPMNPNQREKGKELRSAFQNAGWGDSVIEAAYRIYEITGSAEILLENYDLMKRWFSYLEKRASAPSVIPKMMSAFKKKDNPASKYLVDFGIPLGDSISDMPDPSDSSFLSERYRDMGMAYLCHSGKMMEKIARILVSYVSFDSLMRSEFLDDIGHYEEVSEVALEAYRNAFAKKEDNGKLPVDGLIRALSLDLLPDESDIFVTKKEAGERINLIVSQAEFSIGSLGPLALSALPETLYEAGFKGTAFKILLRLCEREGAYTPEYLTAIGSFVIKHICGIRYSKGVLSMNPEYCPLKKCEGVFEMPDKERVIFGYEFFPDETLKVVRMERKGVKKKELPEGFTTPSSPEK